MEQKPKPPHCLICGQVDVPLSAQQVCEQCFPYVQVQTGLATQRAMKWEVKK